MHFQVKFTLCALFPTNIDNEVIFQGLAQQTIELATSSLAQNFQAAATEAELSSLANNKLHQQLVLRKKL